MATRPLAFGIRFRDGGRTVRVRHRAGGRARVVHERAGRHTECRDHASLVGALGHFARLWRGRLH